jgi:hypothetical protein
MDNQPQNQATPEVIDVNPVPQNIKVKKHHKNRLFWPAILIMVGIILLIQNISPIPLHLNWWAAFIYIPVLGSLVSAFNSFEKSGKFDAAVRSSLGGVIVVGTIATMLLLGVDWQQWWPLVLIAPGLSMLINSISFADNEKHPSLAKWNGLGLWFGLAMLILGIGFLSRTLPIPALENYLFTRWWSIAILIPGVGAFINALVICARNGFRPNWTVWAFSIIGVAFTATGLFAFFNLNWNFLGPIILIAAGIIVLSGMMVKRD